MEWGGIRWSADRKSNWQNILYKISVNSLYTFKENLLAPCCLFHFKHVKSTLRQQKIKCPIAITPDLFLVTCVTNQPLEVNTKE